MARVSKTAKTTKTTQIPKTTNPQSFRLEAPQAQSVFLVGDFTHWQERPIPMQKNKEGFWSVSVQLEPGRHVYRFIVDGQWCDDPECKDRVPNPFGGTDMLREAA